MLKRIDLVALAVFVMALFAAGCAPQYGSPTVHTTVDVAPNKAYVYAIPHDVWLKNGDEAMLNDSSLIMKYRVGVSPAKDNLKRNRRYIFAAKRDNEWTWIERTVSTDSNEFLIEFLE